MPVFLPATFCVCLALRIASSSASFLSIRVFFHFANVSGVTGVRFGPSLCRYDDAVESGRIQAKQIIHKRMERTSTSRNSSRLITFALAASASAFFCAFSTKPAGNACLYWHFSPPFGHSQNHPNLSQFKSGSIKVKHSEDTLVTFDSLDKVFADNLNIYQPIALGNLCPKHTSVMVRGFPCFESTTFLNFSSSHVSMVSLISSGGQHRSHKVNIPAYSPASFSSLVSEYKFFFSTFLSTFKS
jgi:hypothetical protein